MYEETACFDPEGAVDGYSELMAGSSTTNSPNCFDENLKLSIEELSYHHHHQNLPQGHIGVEFDNPIGFNNNNMSLIQDSNQILTFDQSNWNNDCNHEIQNLTYNQQLQHHPDLLNLFQLPNASISFANHAVDGVPPANVLYEPLLHMNLPPQPPLFRELFQSLPYSLPTARNGSLFGVVDDGDGDADGQQFENGILEFSRDMACIGKGGDGNNKHFATERQRRQHLNGKYTILRGLIPNPTKVDRASVVGDAIEYIKELNRTVNELKLLVEKKRCSRERRKRHKTEDDAAGGEVESINTKPIGDSDQSYNGSSLRSSWLQRKSTDAEVDVRIIEDEVTIKLVQRKNINCLLYVSKILDELQLDLHHVAGGHIGHHCTYLFNTKILKGSSVYASAVANKLIEAVDRQ